MTRDEFVTNAIRDGKSFTDAMKAWDEYRKENPSNSRGSTQTLFDKLRDEVLTEDEWKDFLATQSVNIRRHEKFWMKIWKLADDVRKQAQAAKIGRKAA